MTYSTNYFEALTSLRPGAKFSMTDDGIQWQDTEQTQPSEAEVTAEMARIAAERPRKEARAARAAAFAAEADPLFFKAQRGEATTEEWESKVSEIRARFPYPEEVES